MTAFSTAAIREKNKVKSDGVFLLLVEVYYSQEEEPIRICWNAENYDWNGYTWIGAPFDLGDRTETKEAELPDVTFTVRDIDRILSPHLDQQAGAVDSTVVVYVINTNLLSETAPLFEEEYSIIKVAVDSNNTISFSLGAEDLSQYRSPADRFIKSHCRYGPRHGGFKGGHCGYTGSETLCNRTFSRCLELGNSARFGGFLGVGKQGYWGT